MTFRTVPSFSQQALSMCALWDAGLCPDQLFSSLGKRMAALMCGTCWKRPVNLYGYTHTLPTPRLRASNPGPPHVSSWPLWCTAQWYAYVWLQ